MEQIEDGQEDHNVLARLAGETATVDAGVREKLTWFVQRVFAHVGGKQISVGQFLGPEAAQAHVLAHLVPYELETSRDRDSWCLPDISFRAHTSRRQDMTRSRRPWTCATHPSCNSKHRLDDEPTPGGGENVVERRDPAAMLPHHRSHATSPKLMTRWQSRRANTIAIPMWTVRSSDDVADRRPAQAQCHGSNRPSVSLEQKESERVEIVFDRPVPHRLNHPRSDMGPSVEPCEELH